MTLHRQTWAWRSPELDREMPVARWGHWGKPLLLFPTAGGDFLEHERMWMVRALSPLIEQGVIKLYTCDNVNRVGWIDKSAHPRQKTAMQARFDRYLEVELLPFIRHDCEGSEIGIATAGVSLGAYNAVTAACKHPGDIDLAFTMSGTFDLQWRLEGYWDLDFYYNSPLHFLPNLGEVPQLDRLRHSRFIITAGHGRAESPEYSARMVQTLRSKRIPTVFEVYGPETHHDWPSWRERLPDLVARYVER